MLLVNLKNSVIFNIKSEPQLIGETNPSHKVQIGRVKKRSTCIIPHYLGRLIKTTTSDHVSRLREYCDE
ncbi:unnamed protein product [Rhizophagus irregularis]|nr:unnamed protein product [Rhizophagus irregularis]CAB5201592.1 unnamed protein product [Rhizophagus irregularis]